jgi:hypothetical protein
MVGYVFGWVRPLVSRYQCVAIVVVVVIVVVAAAAAAAAAAVVSLM